MDLQRQLVVSSLHCLKTKWSINVDFKILFSITGNFPSNAVSLLSNNIVNVVVVKVRKK